MGKSTFFFWGSTFVLFGLGGCGGGQTGQPGSGDAQDCSWDKSGPADCCRIVDFEERIDGVSARDLLASHGSVRGVPLFWSEIPETGDEAALEPEQSPRTALSLELSLDETSPIQFCNETTLDIPVHAVLTTDDGFAAEFSTLFSWSPFFEATPSGTLQVVPGLHTEGLSNGMSASCPTIISFDAEGVSGRFCDDQRRLALFPTACDGIAQVDPSEAPYPPLEAPLDYLTPFDSVTLTYEDLPPITVSGALDDPSACYASRESYWIAADLSFETDGVRLEANDVLGYAAPHGLLEDAERLAPGLRTEFAESCGDVSESAAWGRVAAEAESAAGALCLTFVYEKLADGTLRYAAEVTFEGTYIGVFVAG